MPRTIRFHLDEHCPHAIADGLRRFGIDVTTAAERLIWEVFEPAEMANRVESI